MLRSSFIILLLLSFCHLAKAKYVSINGKIDQPIGETLSFSLLNNPLTGEKTRFIASIGSTNEFNIGLEVNEAQIIEVEYGEQKFEVFVSPADQQLNLEFNSQNILGTLRFQGDGAFENNFLVFFRTNYDSKGGDEEYKMGGFTTHYNTEIVNKAKVYEASDYFRILNDQYQNKQRYLHNQPTLNRVLYHYLDKETQWKYETHKIAYFIYNKDRINHNDLRRYWVRYALLQTVDITDEKSLKHEPFQNLLESFVHYLYLETPVEADDLGKEYYRFIQRNFSERCRYFMLAKLMFDNYVTEGNSGIVQEMFKNYKTFNPYPEYTNILNSTFGSSMQYVAKEIVPNFQVKDEVEKNIWLSDYQGKVVHISFWASWCAPCLKSFRESYLARQQLQKMGVVLLNINMDKTEPEWRQALFRENIQGINVFPVDISEMRERFKVSALPFYLTVDKNGQRSYLSTSDLNVAQRDLLELMRE